MNDPQMKYYVPLFFCFILSGLSRYVNMQDLMRVAFPRDYKFFIYWNLVPKITIDLIQMSAIYNFMTFSDSSGWDYY